ncbi:hypothetical protein WA158_002375 [Blastocystis sp. Blastoise]
MSINTDKIIVPRNFKLLNELHESEHPPENKPVSQVSWGLPDLSDRYLHNWECTINPIPGTRFYYMLKLKAFCSDNYPNEPPKFTFVSKVNLPFVNSRGEVIPSGLDTLKNWNCDYTIEKVLLEIYSKIGSSSCRNLNQPSEGQTY